MVYLVLLFPLNHIHVEHIVHFVYIRKNDYPTFDINGHFSQTGLKKNPRADFHIIK